MLKELIQTLNEIETSTEIKHNQWLTDGVEDELHPLIQKAINLAENTLITNSGSCNYNNISTINKTTKFKISAGEQDSFGWLTGKIHTSKGFIVYG